MTHYSHREESLIDLLKGVPKKSFQMLRLNEIFAKNCKKMPLDLNVVVVVAIVTEVEIDSGQH